MKVGIRQKVLLEMLNKGSVAAMSDIAQTDTSTLSLLIKSIKINVDKNFTVESNTDLIAEKFIGLAATEENGIIVKEEGSVVVPAKELIDFVKLQGEESTITMSLQKLQTPEIIDTLGDMGDGNDDKIDKSKFSIKKIGDLKIVSKDSSKTQTKWETDCFDPECRASVNFSEKSEKIFEIKGEQLLEAIDKVKFATIDKDNDHVFDSVSVQVYDKSIYFAATDMQHCAIYKISDGVKIHSEKSLLIPCELMESVAKIIDKEKSICFSYNSEKEKIYISQDNVNIRVACTDKNNISKFPSIDLLLKKKYEFLSEFPKKLMMGLLSNASFVNPNAAQFLFSKENGTLTIKARSEDSKLKPIVRQCELGSIPRDAQSIWGVSHIINGLKVIKTDNVKVYLPDNMKSIKITSSENDDFSYFTMSIDSSLYKMNE